MFGSSPPTNDRRRVVGRQAANADLAGQRAGTAAGRRDHAGADTKHRDDHHHAGTSVATRVTADMLHRSSSTRR